MLASTHRWTVEACTPYQHSLDRQTPLVASYTTLPQCCHLGRQFSHPSAISRNHDMQLLLVGSEWTLSSLQERTSPRSQLLEFVGTPSRQVKLCRQIHFRQRQSFS